MNFSSYINGDSVRNQDLVNWVTLGTFDVPTSESAPVTSINGRSLSFWLLPYNYFDQVCLDLTDTGAPSDHVWLRVCIHSTAMLATTGSQMLGVQIGKELPIASELPPCCMSLEQHHVRHIWSGAPFNGPCADKASSGELLRWAAMLTVHADVLLCAGRCQRSVRHGGHVPDKLHTKGRAQV